MVHVRVLKYMDRKTRLHPPTNLLARSPTFAHGCEPALAVRYQLSGFVAGFCITWDVIVIATKIGHFPESCFWCSYSEKRESKPHPPPWEAVWCVTLENYRLAWSPSANHHFFKEIHAAVSAMTQTLREVSLPLSLEQMWFKKIVPAHWQSGAKAMCACPHLNNKSNTSDVEVLLSLLQENLGSNDGEPRDQVLTLLSVIRVYYLFTNSY